jgi:hypothetical protein
VVSSTSLVTPMLTMHLVALWIATPPESGIADPDAIVDGEPEQPKPGGFGTVSNVTTVSNVAAPPPEPAPEAEPAAARSEAGMRVFAGYGQTDVGNARAWDHGGAALGALLQWYPYMTKRRRVGLGVELGYAYQGLVRRELPEPADPAVEAPFTTSKVQQHFLDLGFALLLRPHASWFSIQPTAGLGVAFYTDRDLYAGQRHAGLVGRSTAFGLTASLALCTAWDIVCVLGGYRWTQRIDAFGVLDGEPFSVPTQGWYAGLGFDVLRVYARLNAQPAAR